MCIFKFNNVCFYSNYPEEDDDEYEEMFQKLFWKMGEKSFEKLLVHLDQAVTKSLSLSRDVLDERRKLETITESVHKEIRFVLYTLLKLKVEKRIIERFKSGPDSSNKTITFETLEMIMNTKPTSPGQYTTNCVNCNMTCHETCPFPDNKEKCIVMKDGYCEICPEKCHYKHHTHQPYVYVMEAHKVTRTYEDLTQKYGNAGDRWLSYKHLIKCQNEIKATQARIELLVSRARDCITRLNEIALKPSSWSRSEYLEMFIAAEKSEGNLGWEDRVRLLETIRDQTEHMVDPSDATPITVVKHTPIQSEPMELCSSLEAAVEPACHKKNEAAIPVCTTG